MHHLEQATRALLRELVASETGVSEEAYTAILDLLGNKAAQYVSSVTDATDGRFYIGNDEIAGDVDSWLDKVWQMSNIDLLSGTSLYHLLLEIGMPEPLIDEFTENGIGNHIAWGHPAQVTLFTVEFLCECLEEYGEGYVEEVRKLNLPEGILIKV